MKLDSINKINNMFEELLNNFNEKLKEIPGSENYDIKLTLSNKQLNSNNTEIILEDDVIKNLKLLKQNNKLEMDINSKIPSSIIDNIKAIKAYTELDKKININKYFDTSDDDTWSVTFNNEINNVSSKLEENDLSIDENLSDETFESLQLYLNLIDESKKHENELKKE